MSVSEDVAAFAETVVNTLTETTYQHPDKFTPAGHFDCDCNGFCALVLSKVSQPHLDAVPKDTQPGSVESRPRAFEYYDFFASLTPDSTGGWHRIDRLVDARRGDVIAYRFPTIERGSDTGHVMIVAETPVLDPGGAFHVVRIYDSAPHAHFDDTREPGGQPSTTGISGVGSGVINVKVDAEGRPIAYLFGPPLDGQYAYRPMAIARLDPI